MDYRVKYLKYKAKYLQLLEQIGSGSNEDKMLMDSVERDNLEAVILALDRGANVNFQTNFGETALIKAAIKGKTQIVELLLNRGADVNMYDKYGGTALIAASVNNNINIVKLLLDNGAIINHQDLGRRTALHLASGISHYEVVYTLIQRGADINNRDIDLNTPLIHTCILGNIGIIELLVEAGADINQRNIDNKSILSIASEKAISNRNFIPIIKLLLMRGATMDEKILENIKQIPAHFFENPHDKEIILNHSTNMLLYSLKQSGINLSPENVENIVSYNKP